MIIWAWGFFRPLDPSKVRLGPFWGFARQGGFQKGGFGGCSLAIRSIFCTGGSFGWTGSLFPLPKESAGSFFARSLFAPPALSFHSLLFSVLPRKNLKFTKDFLSLPNPQDPWKRQRKYQNNQGNSLLKVNQGNPKNQGMEGQGGVPRVMDVRAFRSWTSAPKCLFIPRFRGRARSS